VSSADDMKRVLAHTSAKLHAATADERARPEPSLYSTLAALAYAQAICDLLATYLTDPPPDPAEPVRFDADNYALMVTMRADTGLVEIQHQAGDTHRADQDMARLAAEIHHQLHPTPPEHTPVTEEDSP